MKTLLNFTNTKSFVSYIVRQLNQGNNSHAGKLFEQFTGEWHIEYGDYLSVYDANDLDSIPKHIVSKLDAWELLNKGANSYGIDKICVTRFNDIDIHQDKSSLHTDKNLSAKKAEGMMSLRDNPLKNVRNFVINTTAKDLSHYKSVWKDQTPITFGFDAFVPDVEDKDAVARDKQFWKNIKQRAKGKSTPKIHAFNPRNSIQSDIVSSGVEYVTKTLVKDGYCKWHNLIVGGVGKSVLDPVVLAEVEHLFDPAYTNTPQPVSVGFWHSSKTLPKNGWEMVMRRRAKGIYDEVIVVSGTDIIDGENDTSVSNRFVKTTKASDAVWRIKKALKEDKSVLLLALYHHSEQVMIIKNALNKYYPGFKFWFRYRDECDWPCSNANSSFSFALDDRTESVLTFGSSGTARLGKDPVNDYGMNNVNIHGPTVYNYTWPQAERDGLVKPFILVIPSIRESEMVKLFPELVNKDGRIDWQMKVDGIPVDNDYPTAGLIADIVCYVRAMVEFPEIKRVLMFAHFVRTNKLAEANFKWVADKILGNSTMEKAIRKMFFTTLRDDQYNTLTLKDKTAIKKAKSYERYTIGSSKVFSRGYDDVYSPKHHAAIHWDPKGDVVAIQEIWRVVRLDPECDNPYAYYVCPQRINDIDDEPTWCEDRLALLQNIFKHNKSIREEFESLLQTPGKRSRSSKRQGKIWIPEGFDPKDFDHLVSFVARTTRGEVYENIAIQAHTDLLQRYLALPVISNAYMAPTGKEWLANPQFKLFFETFKLFKTSPKMFRERFWGGNYVMSAETSEVMAHNLVEFKEHKEKLLEARNVALKKVAREYESLIAKTLDGDSNYRRGIQKSLAEKYGVDIHWANTACRPITDKWVANTKHWHSQKQRVYTLLFEVAKTATSMDELKNGIRSRWHELDIIGCEWYGRIPSRFMNDYWNVLTVNQKNKLKALQKQIHSKTYSKSAKKRIEDGFISWNKGLTKDTDERLAGVGRSHKKLWADPEFVAKESKRRKEAGARESFRKNCRKAQQKFQKEMSEEQRQSRLEAIRRGIVKREQRRALKKGAA